MSHHAWPKLIKFGKITKGVLKSINQRNYEENAFECLILGRKLTRVKFVGAFDGVIENT